MRLQIFARHVAGIWAQEANGKPQTYHPCDGIRAEVTITPSHFAPSDRVWDQVDINGKWCGNRHGGVKAFCVMVNAAAPEITYGPDEIDDNFVVPLQPIDHPETVACGSDRSMVGRRLAVAS